MTKCWIFHCTKCDNWSAQVAYKPSTRPKRTKCKYCGTTNKMFNAVLVENEQIATEMVMKLNAKKNTAKEGTVEYRTYKPKNE